MNIERALQILQLKKGFSVNDARKSFRKIAFKLHPDLNNDFNSNLWNEVVEAYNYVCNHFEGDFNLKEFEKYFYEIKRKIVGNIFLKIKKKDFNFDKIIFYKKIFCSYCLNKNKLPCRKCNGTGMLIFKTGIYKRQRKCNICTGTGVISSCDFCGGKIIKKKKVELLWSEFKETDSNYYIAEKKGNELGDIITDVYVNLI